MSRTLSSTLDIDLIDDPTRPRIIGLVRTATALWVIAEVTNPEFDDDRYRAYADDQYRNRTGIVSLNSPTRTDVIRRAREEGTWNANDPVFA